ncbi:hypothetical protein ACFQ0O_29085 [Saccharopolyspora spinosporotrichia]
MKDDDVFGRRWVLTEDELLRMLWRCHAGRTRTWCSSSCTPTTANRNRNRGIAAPSADG